MKDCVVIFCKGHPDCKMSYTIPIGTLRRHLTDCSLKELCDRYICCDCRLMFDKVLDQIEERGLKIA
jgi:hypothetical protein